MNRVLAGVLPGGSHWEIRIRRSVVKRERKVVTKKRRKKRLRGKRKIKCFKRPQNG
jgi:hypothetical protein